VSAASVLRLLRAEGLLLEANYQRERRRLAARWKAAFGVEPTGPNQVWQLDLTEFETTTGGTWRLAGCRDYWSKYELGWHVSPTANQHDAIAAVELALIEAEQLAVTRLVDLAPRDADGNVEPLITSVTDIQTRWRSDDVRSARCGSSPVGGSARPRADADPARRVVPTPSRCSRPPPRVRRAATSRRRGERGEHARPDHRSQPDHHGVAGPQTPQEAGLVAHRSSSSPAGAPGRQFSPTAVVVPSGWTTRAARWPRPVSQRAASGPRA
jgi:hypothetical protein